MRIRKLFVEVVTKWAGEAKLKAVKVAGDAAAATLKNLSDTADHLADRADRTTTILREMATAVRAVGTVRMPRVVDAPGSSAANAGARAPRSSGGSRPAADPLDAAIRRANISESARAGLAAGSEAIRDAAKALDPLANASEKAKAKISDLVAQVERNRKEMAQLKAQAIQTGDAEGTLAARMKGLSVATLDAQSKLGAARRELRALDGSLIDAVKSTGGLSAKMTALGTFAGNVATNVASRTWGGVQDAIVGSTKSAMDFEKSLVDIQKVARGADETAAGMAKIESGIKAASKELGVLPNQVAELAAQITPVFSGKEDIVGLTKDVTKIGVAWDVSGQAAGKFFADTSRGLGYTATETKNLFGAVNELGNVLGVKSADIAEALTRSAGVLKASGLSGSTGAALNATLIAAGASAEVAATGVRTFVARLEAGAAATPKQVEAFKALGLEATQVGEEMSKGGKVAEEQILRVVQAIGSLPKKDQLPTLIELFGSESIGSIGAAATAVDTLSSAFKIAGAEGANFNSVLKEYERASNTSAAKVEKLKANIAVLAISLGDKLLPYVDKVVAFLTSPEGQEWGESAVRKAVSAVETFATVLGGVAKILGGLVENFGGVTVAIGLMGGAMAIAVGPWGALAAAAAVSIGLITSALTKANEGIIEMEGRTRRLADNKLFQDAADAVDSGQLKGEEAEAKAKDLQAIILEKKKNLTRSSSKSLTPESIKAHAEIQAQERKDLERLESQLARVEYVAGRSSKERAEREAAEAAAKAKADEEAAAYGTPEEQAASNRIAEQEELRYLRGKRRKGTLRESEKKRIRELEKSTDAVVEKRGRGGGGGFNEEQRRIAAEGQRLTTGNLAGVLDEDKLAAGVTLRLQGASRFRENYHLKALAGADPALAAVLERGRQKGKNGVLDKPTNELDKALEDRMVNGPSTLSSLGGRGSDATPGPSIRTTYEYHQTANIQLGSITVEPAGDTSIDRIRGAGRQAAETIVTGWKEAAIVFGQE